MSHEYPIVPYDGNRGGKYGFSPARLPFQELRPGTADSFAIPIEEELLRSNQDKIRALIFNAARAKGVKVRILREVGALIVIPADGIAPTVRAIGVPVDG